PRPVVVRTGLPRRFVILAGGFGIGLVILVAILVISTWYFHGSLEQELPGAEAPALEPSAVIVAGASAAQPTDVPTPEPTSTPRARPEPPQEAPLPLAEAPLPAVS